MTAAARTSASFPPDFIRRLEAALGRPIVEPNDAKAYLTDWRGFLTAHNAIVVRPGSTGEVAKIVRACAEARVPIVPQGGLVAHVDARVAFAPESETQPRTWPNLADADDATQDALLAIVRGLRTFDGQAAFSTWAYRVATNTCLDQIGRAHV